MRLHDNGIASSKRCGRFPAEKDEWIIERKNDDDGAQGFLDREMELAGTVAPAIRPASWRATSA